MRVVSRFTKRRTRPLLTGDTVASDDGHRLENNPLPDPSEIPDQLPEQGENSIPEEMPNQDPAADPPQLNT
jgi:hypothetical protein